MTQSIVTKQTIDSMPGLDKTHFLNPRAKRNNKSLGDLAGLVNIGFHIIELKPGAESTEFHKHYFEEECVYILSGEATSIIGSETEQVGAGDFIGYPAGGEAHMLRNTGTEILRCIVVGQRLDHDVADYPEQNKRIYRNKGLAWDLVEIDHIENPNAGQKR